jgi:hypothetical protein
MALKGSDVVDARGMSYLYIPIWEYVNSARCARCGSNLDALSAAHRRFLFEHGVSAAVLNFVLDGALAWLEFHSADSVPLWGLSSAAVDTLGSAFFIPLVTCLIASRIVDRQLRQGRVPRLLSRGTPLSPMSNRWRLKRGIGLAVASLGIGALPIVIVLSASGGSSFEPWAFIAFQATFGAGVGAAVTPLIVWWALLDGSEGAS